ncbi:MAG TPA: hypothetical protein DCR45_07890 [Gammaproteobacteria bacterium]|nr:hypothetical protein [Gammaproteobacteria bacterium]HAR90881.1 hypothetical protein [Gammaproteobacteria bacterium]HAU25348.1 hypothetical protein [Gammaproteobacteria bacterium]HBP98953.1 hypothetical protein [Gammaproteobacteria bacterium]HCA36375.1 hypothetical protein [Gammaproteobacteria bacterium]
MANWPTRKCLGERYHVRAVASHHDHLPLPILFHDEVSSTQFFHLRHKLLAVFQRFRTKVGVGVMQIFLKATANQEELS